MHADATLADDRGATPLMHAVCGVLEEARVSHPSHAHVVDRLLALGPDACALHATDGDGCTALVLALQHGLMDVAVRLLKAGARPHTVQGQRPLLHATLLSNGSEQAVARVVQGLLDAGCDVNERDGSCGGCTPLCYAPSAALASVLLRHGADVSARDDEGLTALHWACIYNREDVVRVLQDAGVVDVEDSFGWKALDYAQQAGCVIERL